MGSALRTSETPLAGSTPNATARSAPIYVLLSVAFTAHDPAGPGAALSSSASSMPTISSGSFFLYLKAGAYAPVQVVLASFLG